MAETPTSPYTKNSNPKGPASVHSTVKGATQGGAKKTNSAAGAAVRKPKKGALWITRMEQRLKVLRGQVGEVFRSVRSPDVPTRRMSAFFIVCIFGFVLVMATGVRYVWIQRHLPGLADLSSNEQAKNLNVFLQKQADEAKMRFTTQSLGSFTLELKALPDSKPAPGVMNLAEIELSVQCDSREACAYVGDHLPQAKNQVAGIFVALNRDDLLSREGKRKLVRQILERLNEWLPHGKIENLYFSKLVVS